MRLIVVASLLWLSFFPSYSLEAQFVDEHPTVVENSVGTEEAGNKWSQTKFFFLDFIIFLIVVLLSISFIALAASGVNLFSAGGDEGTIQNGWRLLRASLLGMTLSILGYIIVSVIKYFF